MRDILWPAGDNNPGGSLIEGWRFFTLIGAKWPDGKPAFFEMTNPGVTVNGILVSNDDDFSYWFQRKFTFITSEPQLRWRCLRSETRAQSLARSASRIVVAT